MVWTGIEGSTLLFPLIWDDIFFREEFASSEGADSFLYEYQPGFGSKL